MPDDDGANRELAPIREWADLPEWITTEEAAEISGYSLQYVQRLARQGHIGAQKKSRAWWVDRDTFVGYLEAMMARGDKRAGPRRDHIEE